MFFFSSPEYEGVAQKVLFEIGVFNITIIYICFYLYHLLLLIFQIIREEGVHMSVKQLRAPGLVRTEN